MDTNIDELMKDFKETVAKIDFSNYNPASSEFIASLFIGLMWKLLSEMEEHNNTEIYLVKDEEPIDDVGEELIDAKKYYQKYLETSDSIYKEMAHDEMKHANLLIKKMYSKLPNMETKDKLKGYELQLEQLYEHVK